MKWLFLIYWLFPISLAAAPLFDSRTDCNALFYDLEIARFWDEKLDERFPVTFNHLLSGGYFTTPSARMTEEGEIALGGARVPPYVLINARIQPFTHLELSANYRIFEGVDDPGLTPFGFGDFADRGANVKCALFLPEDSYYDLPGIAFGVEDFMGSKKFTNYFIVGTKVWTCMNLEASLGWGTGRYTHGPSRGFFAGAAWYPCWHTKNPWIAGFGLAAEYDPVNYSDPKREPHPCGHISHTPVNAGIKYNFKDILYLSASRIRGEEYAVAGSLHYNWGSTKGFFPKILDPLPYTAPRDTEPLGCYRPENVMIHGLNYALEEQGFRLTKANMEEDGCGGERLWIHVVNQRYRLEENTRLRLQHLLANLVPANLSAVVVVLESFGVPCQQYVYPREILERYACKRICDYEFNLITPRQEVCLPCDARQIFFHRLDPWRFRLSPRMETFFGSSKGKFKYDLGVKADLEGFLPYNIFYELQCSYTLASTVHDVGDFDLYNPSQLPNVLTDYVNYRKWRTFSTDKAYLQKSWNFGGGWFSRAAAGYFQVNYAGVAGEILYYPAHSLCAFGLEGAVLKKRTYHGLAFQDTLRKLKGFTPTYISYSTLQQYFFNLYFDFPEWRVETKIGAGQFLARDKGIRCEATRYFESGLRITGWITYTNAKDNMHGETFFNKGIALELPLDLFSRCSHRRIWNYGLAAWLRDAGAFIPVGRNLFEMINRERRL